MLLYYKLKYSYQNYIVKKRKKRMNQPTIKNRLTDVADVTDVIDVADAEQKTIGNTMLTYALMPR